MKAKGTKIAKNSNANVENTLGVLPVKPAYGVMYYKRGHTIGIRLKTGSKKLVFGFGGRNATHKNKPAMQKVGQEIVTFLEADNDLAYSEAKSEGQRRSEAT